MKILYVKQGLYRFLVLPEKLQEFLDEGNGENYEITEVEINDWAEICN